MERRVFLLGVAAGVVGCSRDGRDVAKPSGTARLATGNPEAVYATYGAGLARLLQEETGAELVLVPTDGSAENLRLLGRSGGADIGFSLADSASDAYQGVGAFARDRIALTALARTYENYVHVCVPRESDVQRLTDLRGKTVSLGSPLSGTQVVAQRVLNVAGVRVRPLYLDLGAAARALANGRIDALFWSGGLPTEPLTRLQSGTGFRLIDIEGAAAELAKHRSGVYVVTSVPPSVYGTENAVTTLSVPNYLLARDGLPDSWAWWTLDTLFRRQADLFRVHPEAGSLDVRSAIATMPIPLHPAAARWYRDDHL